MGGRMRGRGRAVEKWKGRDGCEKVRVGTASVGQADVWCGLLRRCMPGVLCRWHVCAGGKRWLGRACSGFNVQCRAVPAAGLRSAAQWRPPRRLRRALRCLASAACLRARIALRALIALRSLSAVRALAALRARLLRHLPPALPCLRLSSSCRCLRAACLCSCSCSSLCASAFAFLLLPPLLWLLLSCPPASLSPSLPCVPMRMSAVGGVGVGWGWGGGVGVGGGWVGVGGVCVCVGG